MPNAQYTDQQRTPWFSGNDSPICSGYYEIKIRNSPEIVSGLFKEGRWQLEFSGELYPLSYALGQFEWRGLNFEPKQKTPQPSTACIEIDLGWN